MAKGVHGGAGSVRMILLTLSAKVAAALMLLEPKP